MYTSGLARDSPNQPSTPLLDNRESFYRVSLKGLPSPVLHGGMVSRLWLRLPRREKVLWGTRRAS